MFVHKSNIGGKWFNFVWCLTMLNCFTVYLNDWRQLLFKHKNDGYSQGSQKLKGGKKSSPSIHWQSLYYLKVDMSPDFTNVFVFPKSHKFKEAFLFWLSVLKMKCEKLLSVNFVSQLADLWNFMKFFGKILFANLYR